MTSTKNFVTVLLQDFSSIKEGENGKKASARCG